jgi:hypothetical protein
LHNDQSALYKEAIAGLRDAFSDLLKLASKENFSLTFVFIPPTGPLDRRADTQIQEPELLETASSLSLTTASSVPQLFADDDSTPLTGIIASCFDSLSKCQSTTRNCTGHGECVLKWHGSAKGDDCYGCLCNKPEVRKNPDGSTKTTRFGGGACQKKDVVMPFWLLAGFTIFMVFLVSWGIGLLYSMGNEELPSVIGAGVSGPKAK